MRRPFLWISSVSLFVLAAQGTAYAVTVSVYPASASLRTTTQQSFSASVWYTTNKSVIWAVNGIRGGNSLVGTISSAGVYTAPANVPLVNPVTITATSAADPSVSSAAAATILNPVPVISSVSPAAVSPGPFTITVTGRGFVPKSIVSYGGGPLATTFVSATVVTARGTASLVVGGIHAVTVTNPDPGTATSAVAALQVRSAAALVSANAAARFLQQISWGPTPETIARVQQLGFERYLDEQFAAPAATYPDFAVSPNLAPVQQRFLQNAVTGQDQLRQRMAFALSQIFVVSGMKNPTPAQFVPYLRLLHDLAFTNYTTLLAEMTVNPCMGRFLDLAFNEKANAAGTTRPNENFARELLQLFSIGTERLNLDGSPQLRSGVPVPAYDQSTIESFARALTGWTFPTRPSHTQQIRNPQYFIGRMEPIARTHDMGEKILLDGVRIPPGQTPEQDLEDVIATVSQHPNVGPFIGRRLIQHFVTSNPSPAYVARVATAFNAGAQRGDFKAVIEAIVLDPEARTGDAPGPAAPPVAGHLREPVLYLLALMRSLDASIQNVSLLPGLTATAGQSLFYAPSVFSYFSPLHEIPASSIRAPEFQIQTPSTAVFRANIAYFLAYGPQGVGVSLDLTPFERLAADAPLLVEAVNQALLAGSMSLQTRQTIEEAVLAATSNARLRAQAAIYLTASSSQFQIQR